jgi:hypothetical protein
MTYQHVKSISRTSIVLQLVLGGVVAFGPAPLAAQEQQGSATILVQLIGGFGTPVTEGGRRLGVTGERFSVAPGVHNLRIANVEQCVFVELGSAATIAIAPGVAPALSGNGAYRCADAWSQLVVQSVPEDATIQASAGQSERSGSDVVIRVPLPGPVTISVNGTPYAPVNAQIRAGASEIVRYRLKLAPRAPELLSDSILETPPREPAPPARPAAATPPTDPSGALAAEQARLLTVQSGRASYHAGMFTAIVSGAALAYSIFADRDSLTPWPTRRKPVLISFWTGAGFGVLALGGFADATAKKSRAGCGASLSACQGMVEAEIRRLRDAKERYPADVLAAKAETAKRNAEYDRRLADFPAVLEQWKQEVQAVERRNVTIRANRDENNKRMAAWQAAVTGAGLTELGRRRR